MIKKILVTGGAGFIGSHVVDKLVDRGDKIIVIDNFNTYYSPVVKKNNIIIHQDKQNFYLHKADIRSKSSLNKIFSKYNFDCVVHLAAMAGVRPSMQNPQLYVDVNVLGTLNILEHAKKHAVKQLVFISSSSVYGNRKRGPFKETDKTDKQISPYGATKKAAELLCYTYSHLYNIKTTILRLFTVYGPRNRPDMACYKFIDNILKNKPVVRFGKGNTGRDYTYVDDVVCAITTAIDKPLDFEVINIGNSTPIKLNQLIKVIEEVVGKHAIIKKELIQDGDVSLTYADIKKAIDLLGYKPKRNLRQGLKILLKWYESSNRLKKC